MATLRKRPAPLSSDATEERLLLGAQPLSDLLNLASSLEGLGRPPSRARLSDRWRSASREYQRMAVSEAGAADRADIRPLPKAMNRHLAQLVELPGVRRTFDTVPVAFGLVELDKLVVSQHSMTQAVVERIITNHPLPLSPKALAELCLPLKPPAASFRLASRSGREFTFVADAHDMRFLDAQVLDPVDVRQAEVMGHPQAVVALSVGFSANLLNGVRYNGRVAINNGHHRALALRKMGFTHAPCLIQPCASEDDLGQAATRELCDNVDLYFHAPRPPLLRDFDNPKLTLSVQAPRMRRVLTLRIDVQRQLMAL
ncbi:hypothetical protein [Hydrogenophaga sp. RWCD_12]|uniref:hypothetical protein n=1 Tax=Hydrogenophaga sp. RWCD_12 TaxID=3391190 RepID=UPI0039848AF8